VGRTRHPETDAEKMRAEGDRIIELSRTIASETAAGEFIGVAKFTADGAAEMIDAFDAARAKFAGQVFREKRTFEKAYLIDLFQDMIEKGSSFHRVDTHGGYMEIDTLQDESFAASWWNQTS
jgi:choline kinase